MEYIDELKTGLKYFFSKEQLEWTKDRIDQVKKNRENAIIFQKPFTLEQFREFVKNEEQVTIFTNLKHRETKDLLWSCCGLPNLDMYVLTANKHGIQCMAYANQTVHMDDKRFGLPDEDIDNIIGAINNCLPKIDKTLELFGE